MRRDPTASPGLWAVTALVLAASSLPGQAPCAPTFGGGLARAGVDNEVLASTMWDPDGAGPLLPRLVVGGRFITAGATLANGIAAFDFTTSTWSNFGEGIVSTLGGGRVTSLRAGANGELFAAGWFTHAGGTPARNVARWDGSSWQPLGSGCGGHVTHSVEALALMPNGDLVAGGIFSVAGGTSANNIARWDGSQWWPLSTGVAGSNPIVLALLARANGTLVAAGNFTTAGGTTCNYVAAWSGTAWSAFGAGLNQGCRALAERAGSLLACEWPASVQAWDGVAWSLYGTNAPIIADAVRRLQVLPNGDVLALRSNEGIFRCTGPSSPWTQVSDITVPGAIEVLAANDYIVGGRFASSSSNHLDGVGRWNGATWTELTGGLDGSVLAASAFGSGYVLGGRFLHIGGIAANRVARWDGAAFQPLGSGVNGEVARMARHGTGSVAVAGTFTSAGGAAAPGFASWNGSAWSTLLGGPGGAVVAMATMPNGDLLVVLTSGVLRRWNGAAWSNFATPLSTNDYITCIAVRANGEVLLGGALTTVGQPRGLMRWTGSAWQALGTAFDAYPWVIAEAANGDVYAGGEFTSAGGSQLAYHIARWNGTAWSPVRFGTDQDVRAIVGLPDGDMLVGGAFRRCEYLPVAGIARWNGELWMPVTPGTNGGVGGWNGVTGLVPLANGDCLAYGAFGAAGGLAAAQAFTITPGCTPAIAAMPTLCRGEAGPLSATAAQPATVGQSFASMASGFAAGSIAFPFFGFMPYELAYFSVHATALPGCGLLVHPDVVGATLPVAGVATSTIAIPASPSVVGLGLYHQFASLQWNAAGALSAITFSNGLALVIQP